MSTANRRYDASARQADAQTRRRTVVEAAGRLFLADGYAETTIARIAAEAGVSAQLVYAAFGGKAGLLSAVIDLAAAGDDEPILMRDRPEWTAIAEITDPVERMRAAAAQTGVLNARVGPLIILLDRVAGSDPAVADLQARLVELMREDHRVIVERLMPGARLDLGPDRLADVSRMVTSSHMWHGLVVESGWTQEQYVDWLADALVRLFFLDGPGRPR